MRHLLSGTFVTVVIRDIINFYIWNFSHCCNERPNCPYYKTIIAFNILNLNNHNNLPVLLGILNVFTM